MQRSELAEDDTASEATSRPDERAAGMTSAVTPRDAEPAQEAAGVTARTAPTAAAGGSESEGESAAAAEPLATAEPPPQAAPTPRPFKPSPRPRTAPRTAPRPVEAPVEAEAESASEATLGDPTEVSEPAAADDPAAAAQPAAADDPAAAAESAPQAVPAQRPFKPSPRPRTASADPPTEATTQAVRPAAAAQTDAAAQSDRPAEGAAPAELQQPNGLPAQSAPAESPAPAEPDARAPGPASSPGWGHLAEDDHSNDPETVEAAAKDPDVGAKARKRWGRRILVGGATIALMLFIPAYVMRMYGIPSESMETTLHGCAGCDNDRVLVDRTVYRFRDPRPGEVVVFTAGQDVWSNSEEQDPGESNPLIRGLQSLGETVGIAAPSGPDFVKRVIAVEGQTVSCCDSRNRILVDGVPIDEPYVYFSLAAGPAKQASFPKVKVPEGMMWMMGDNRNASLDSRAPGNGPVPVSALAGKVRMIIYPLSRLGSVDDTNPQEPH